MTFNGQVIYRGRKIITDCGMEKYEKNMEILKQKVSRSCATISRVLGNINEAIDYRVTFTDNVKK